jgi:hypothetical protein
MSKTETCPKCGKVFALSYMRIKCQQECPKSIDISQCYEGRKCPECKYEWKVEIPPWMKDYKPKI